MRILILAFLIFAPFSGIAQTVEKTVNPAVSTDEAEKIEAPDLKEKSDKPVSEEKEPGETAVDKKPEADGTDESSVEKKPEEEGIILEDKSAEEGETVTISFSNADLKEVIKVFEQYTGKRFLFDESIVSRRQINLLSSTAIPVESIIDVFESILEVEGLTLVNIG